MISRMIGDWRIAFLLVAFTGSVNAMDFHIGGFGTASLSCVTNDSADYVINDQPEGPGRSRHCDGGLDSLLGVQVDLGLLDSLEIGVQAIADRNEDRDYLPTLMVAQLRWHATESLTFRLGRMPTPAFLHSESRQVRYAMPWVRPPLEVYGLLPTFSHDGVEFIYNDNLGGWAAEWQGGFMRVEFDTPLSNSKDTSLVKSYGGFLNLTLEQGGTLVKLSYLYNETSFSPPSVEALFSILNSPLFAKGADLVNDLAVDQSPTHLFAVGLKHEYDDWLFMGEFGLRTLEGFYRDQYGLYATLGRRFGAWMPYATVARRWTDGPKTDARAGVLRPQVEVLLASTRFDSSSLALGVAYDVSEQIKFKFQTDWIQADDNSWGRYVNHGPDYDFANPKSNWLFTLGLDFVF